LQSSGSSTGSVLQSSELRTQRTIQAALIGYGYAGRTFHAPLLSAAAGLNLAVVGSSNPSAVHADLPDADVCSAFEATTHPDVDLVVIATPNDTHHPLAAAALRAGKHVVLDKPFTLDLEEARSLRDIARERGRMLSVFHNRRWESEALATKEVLSSGRLGEVSYYECHMDRFRPTVRRRWREDAGPGAGLWFDLGPHLIDLALHLFGLPSAVQASFAILRQGGQTDDWAHVQLIYRGSVRVILHATLLAAGGGPRSILHGDSASWMKFGADVQESQLKAGMLPDDPAFGVDPEPGIVIDGATGSRSERPAPRGDQRLYYAGIRDAILFDQRPPVSVAEAVAVMAVLEASFAAGADGKTLPLPLTAREISEFDAARSAPAEPAAQI
jgi:predicted dehydrogenase